MALVTERGRRGLRRSPAKAVRRNGNCVRKFLSLLLTLSEIGMAPPLSSRVSSTSVTSACSWLGCAPSAIERPFGKAESMPRSTRSTSPIVSIACASSLGKLVRLIASMMSKRPWPSGPCLSALDRVVVDAELVVDADRVGVAHDDRVQEVRREVREVVARLRAVVLVLVLEADQRLVDERQAEARDLDPGAEAAAAPRWRRIVTWRRLDAAQTPSVCASLGPIVGALPVPVSSVVGISSAIECVLKPATPSVGRSRPRGDVREIEDAAEVDVEAVVARAGEDAPAAVAARVMNVAANASSYLPDAGL